MAYRIYRRQELERARARASPRARARPPKQKVLRGLEQAAGPPALSTLSTPARAPGCSVQRRASAQPQNDRGQIVVERAAAPPWRDRLQRAHLHGAGVRLDGQCPGDQTVSDGGGVARVLRDKAAVVRRGRRVGGSVKGASDGRANCKGVEQHVTPSV